MQPFHAGGATGILGITSLDTAGTVRIAYDLQTACDSEQTPKYLAALEDVSKGIRQGKDDLQVKIITERSLGRYTISQFMVMFLYSC